MPVDKNESGNIKISDEAVCTIAAIAAKSVDGVAGLDGGAMANISEMIGVKNAGKGVKAEMGAESVSIDINIIVSFGADIGDVAAKVQDAIRENIEKMTGLTVEKVNVNINSVSIKGALSGE